MFTLSDLVCYIKDRVLQPVLTIKTIHIKITLKIHRIYYMIIIQIVN